MPVANGTRDSKRLRFGLEKESGAFATDDAVYRTCQTIFGRIRGNVTFKIGISYNTIWELDILLKWIYNQYGRMFKIPAGN